MKWILILEKDEWEYLHLERIITRLGFRPYRAASLDQGFHYMAESIPDLLIYGEQVTDSDPLAFCSRIRQDPATEGIPALLATSNRDVNFKIKALKAGYAEVVYRPLSIRNLYEKLELCFSTSRRVHIRAPMSFPVDVFNKHYKQTLETGNFGEGGMYLLTENPLPKKTNLNLQFKLPGFDTILHMKGRAVHANTSSQDAEEIPSGMGIQFINLESTLKAMLGIYMENFLATTTPLATTQGRLWCAEHGDARSGYQTG